MILNIKYGLEGF